MASGVLEQRSQDAEEPARATPRPQAVPWHMQGPPQHHHPGQVGQLQVRTLGLGGGGVDGQILACHGLLKEISHSHTLTAYNT